MQTRAAQSRDIGQAYATFRPVLYRALAALARRGFVLHPVDGSDFIHDFFIEQWNALCATFDPSKGNFEAYLYGAFVRFARPRIVRLRRLQNSLVDPEVLDTIETDWESPEQRVSHELDRTFLYSLISSLPPFQRDILIAYLYSEAHSERSIARQFSISRYQVKEALVEALARIITAFPKPPGISENDWRIAYSVWKEGRTLQETATLLQVPLQQVKNSIARVSVSVGKTLRGIHYQSGEKTMATSKRKAVSAAKLLQETLSSIGNERLLNELRTRADEVLSAMESTDIPIDEAGAKDPIWIARVYDVLAGGAEGPLTPELERLERALFETQQKDLTAIGKAFVETLLPDLPVELVKFNVFFANAPRITAEELQLLSDEPDVRAAFPKSADLLIFGIRPVTVFYATEAVSALLERLLRYGMIEQKDVFLTTKCGEDYTPAISKRNVDVSIPGEIAQMANCSLEASHLLLKWLVEVAEYKPFVFGGFEAEMSAGGVVLKPTAQTFGDLYQRWSVALQYAD